MRQREEGENRPIMRNVTTEIGGISALIPGTGSYVRNMKVRYNGQIVTQVPEGQQFDILCDFYAENIAGGIGQSWSACVTVIDTVGGEVRNYRTETSVWERPGHIADNNALINSKGANIMPSHNINLRFWLWGNDALLPAGPPAENLW